MDLTNPALIAIATTAAGEALKTWGSYTIVLIVLGVMHWRSGKRESLKDEEITSLRAEIKLLQDKRLEDAQKMIEVTKVGTATIASRGESDLAVADALKRLANKLDSVVDGHLTFPKPPRRPSR